MYVDKCTAHANGKTYTRYLLRESRREGKKTIKTTILNITPWGERTGIMRRSRERSDKRERSKRRGDLHDPQTASGAEKTFRPGKHTAAHHPACRKTKCGH